MLNSEHSPVADSPPAARFRWWWKLPVSLWIVYHVTGLFIGPASIPPSSPLIRDCWPAFGPYLQWVYMNHGYHFFAPEPGPSTLVTYQAKRADGQVVTGQIPDLQRHVPRLLYHRHFMLTETLAGLDETDPQLQALLVRALARQICQEEQAESVTLTKVTHLLPTMEWCRAGQPLDHPDMFLEVPLGRFEWSDF